MIRSSVIYNTAFLRQSEDVVMVSVGVLIAPVEGAFRAFKWGDCGLELDSEQNLKQATFLVR